MQKIFQKKMRLYVNAGLVLFALLMTMQACRKIPPHQNDFEQVNLVANKASYGAVTVDANLINGWGIAFASSGPAWVSANGTGLSTIYNAAGTILRPPVTIPTNNAATGGHPTGQVFNGGTGFKLSNNNPARFIFAGEDGVISAWNGGSAAVVAINNPNAVYKGLAMATDANNATFLYAANFKERKIDVYDTLWNKEHKPFNDPGIPSDYAPFNIQNVGGKLYVLYAKKGGGIDEEAGAGKGFVDIYNPNGSLVRRFISHGALNAPWGVAQTPASFWQPGQPLNNIILVGNFGDGRINAYDESGRFLGPLRKEGAPIVIPGLWAISFAPVTATSVNPTWLFFAAGPNDEEDGLFGYITPEIEEHAMVK